jgi:hypothetical protein
VKSPSFGIDHCIAGPLCHTLLFRAIDHKKQAACFFSSHNNWQAPALRQRRIRRTRLQISILNGSKPRNSFHARCGESNETAAGFASLGVGQSSFIFVIFDLSYLRQQRYLFSPGKILIPGISANTRLIVDCFLVSLDTSLGDEGLDM